MGASILVAIGAACFCCRRPAASTRSAKGGADEVGHELIQRARPGFSTAMEDADEEDEYEYEEGEACDDYDEPQLLLSTFPDTPSERTGQAGTHSVFLE